MEGMGDEGCGSKMGKGSIRGRQRMDERMEF